jgi:hypothetical protein
MTMYINHLFIDIFRNIKIDILLIKELNLHQKEKKLKPFNQNYEVYKLI